MNTHIPVSVALGMLIISSGCASAPSAARHEPYVKPGLIMLTADQADRRGIKVATADQSADMRPEVGAIDTSAVIAPPGIKVFTLGRTVDSADPNLLHEQHVIYRRETSPSWRLQAPADRKILVGPQITDGGESLQPLLNKELTAFLSDQRRSTEANQKAIAALFDAVSTLSRQQEALLRRDATHDANANGGARPDTERVDAASAEPGSAGPRLPAEEHAD